MLARIRSAAVLGVDAYLMDVEVDIASGLPSLTAPCGKPTVAKVGSPDAMSTSTSIR